MPYLNQFCAAVMVAPHAATSLRTRMFDVDLSHVIASSMPDWSKLPQRVCASMDEAPMWVKLASQLLRIARSVVRLGACGWGGGRGLSCA